MKSLEHSTTKVSTDLQSNVFHSIPYHHGNRHNLFKPETKGWENGLTWSGLAGWMRWVLTFLLDAKLLDSHEQQRFLFWKLIFIIMERFTNFCLWKFIWPHKTASVEQQIHSLGSSTWRSLTKVIPSSPQQCDSSEMQENPNSRCPAVTLEQAVSNSCSWLSRFIPHWGRWYCTG